MKPTDDAGSFDEPATDTSSHVTDVATAQSPFFRLPRELRDEIYDLALLSEPTLYCELTLRKGSPPQRRTYIGRNAHRTCPNSQFEIEYSAAAGRRVKSLQAGEDRNGFYLTGPSPSLMQKKYQSLYAKAEEMWLEVSKVQQEDGKLRHNVHAFMLDIPLSLFRDLKVVHDTGTPTVLIPSVVFAFKFPEKAELGPRLRFDLWWDKTTWREHVGDVDCLRFPSDDGSILQQILSIAKEVNWKGSVCEYMIWQRYLVIHARRRGSLAS